MLVVTALLLILVGPRPAQGNCEHRRAMVSYVQTDLGTVECDEETCPADYKRTYKYWCEQHVETNCVPDMMAVITLYRFHYCDVEGHCYHVETVSRGDGYLTENCEP